MIRVGGSGVASSAGTIVNGLINGYVGNVLVADAGAYAGGTVDATTHIQGLLDTLASSGGGKLFIPYGVYKISNTLGIASNVTVSGAGMGKTILRGTAGAYLGRDFAGLPWYATLCMSGADRSVVEHITVDHFTNGTLANGITMPPNGIDTVSTNCQVRFCEVLGYDSHQYLIWNYRAQNTKILYNRINGNVAANTPASQQEGIEVFGGVDVLVQGNTIVNVGVNGIYMNSSQPNTTKTAVRVLDNYISVAQYGIKVMNVQDAGTIPQHANHIHIKNNVVLNAWTNGIESTSAATVSLKDLQITGNTVKNSLQGIRVYGDVGALFDNILVSGNVVEGSTGPTDNAAIKVDGVTNTVIANNILLTGADSGIGVYNSAYVLITSNRVNAMQKHAIYLNTSSRIKISNNMFKDYNASNTSRAGIYAAAGLQLMVTDNSFQVANDYYAAWFVTGCDECQASDNRLLYNSGINPMFRNDGTNPNTSTVTFTAAATTVTVNNTLVSRDCRLLITQEAGPPKAWTVARGADLFAVTIASAAAGTEMFRYEIRQ